MKTLFLCNNGDLLLEDNFNGTRNKIDTIKYYLDCPFKVEDGSTFEMLFNFVMAEVDLMDVIFHETMGNNLLSDFIDEWNKAPQSTQNSLSIDYLRIRKTIEYMEIDKNKGFVDIRVDFDGVGKGGMDYSLEFMTLNEMKKHIIYIDPKLHVKESLVKNDGDISYIGGDCIITLFEVIGTLLYEITFYGPPKERDKSKQKLIDTIDNKNLLGVLEVQLKEAVKIENYEEAANLRNLIEKYKKLGK